ncbi:MAG: dihydroxyacetone kinase subunit DhaK [Candidatus Lokiarchaeota archaeon]|nr:dihydroxyacetone kinase subunit DhaK [Candidatus Lokiarchaeota archaeon]
MKKLINVPQDVPDEEVEGFVRAFPNYVRKLEDARVVVRRDAPVKGKVGILVGGGSGHEPFWFGYTGKGMYDAVVVGEIFSSPTPDAGYKATKAIDGGEGILYLLGNYEGDKMNLGIAKRRAESEGIAVEITNVTDDVASAPKDRIEDRRGIAGNLFAIKIAGAKAESGGSLSEVKEAAEHANRNIRTMGVALSPCILPSTRKPNFTMGEDEMEVGMGIHGEPGIERTTLQPADTVAEILAMKVLEDLPFQEGDQVTALLNGLGGTPLQELFILFRRIDEILTAREIDVYRLFIGNYCTSIDMKGCSLSLMRLDDELRELLDAPADTPYFRT